MTPRQARLGADLFTAAVAVSIGVALAGLTWRVMGDPGTRFGSSPVSNRPQRPIDIAPLIALAPFGASAPAQASLQATDQPLTLRGILLAQPRAASSALISVGDAAPVAFYRGQAVGNGTIDEIRVDHVVLSSGGARSILAFPDKSGGGSGGIAPPPPSASAASPAVASAPAPPSAGGQTLLGSLGAAPSGNGYAVGTQASPAMKLAGLLPGDQLVAINGTPVADAMGNAALLQAASTAGTARIDVVRAGQHLTLSVPLR